MYQNSFINFASNIHKISKSIQSMNANYNDKPASEETIQKLLNSTKQKLSQLEISLVEIEKLQDSVSNQISISNTPDKNIELRKNCFELQGGMILSTIESILALRIILQSKSEYEIRYQMQIINLTQFELSKFLGVDKEKGMLDKLLKYINNSDEYVYLTINNIKEKIGSLSSYCDRNLRNITVHYSNPDKIYVNLNQLKDINLYSNRVINQLDIYDNIYNLIHFLIPDRSYDLSKSIDSTNYFQFLNNLNYAFFEANKRCISIIEYVNNSLSKAWEVISNLKFKKDIIIGMNDNSNDELMQQLGYIISAFNIALESSFLFFDLNCIINNYYLASNNIERSIILYRAYLTETAAITWIYGYNKKANENSLWNRLSKIPEFESNESSSKIKKEIEDLSKDFFPNKRNLRVHYFDNGNSNITLRLHEIFSLNHLEIIQRITRIINLIKQIIRFTKSLLSRISNTLEDYNGQTTESMVKFLCELKKMALQRRDMINVKKIDHIIEILSKHKVEDI